MKLWLSLIEKNPNKPGILGEFYLDEDLFEKYVDKCSSLIMIESRSF
jgi:hypothetical protein